MRLHLNERWVDHLCGLPETGMGYQIVDVVLRNGEQFRGIVGYNSRGTGWSTRAGKIVSEDIVGITRAMVGPWDKLGGWRTYREG